MLEIVNVIKISQNDFRAMVGASVILLLTVYFINEPVNKDCIKLLFERECL
jgi:hypothetical protein